MVDTFKEVYDENNSSEEPPTYDEVVFASQFDRTVADFRKTMIRVEERGSENGITNRSQNFRTNRFTASAPRPPTPTSPIPLPRSTTVSPPSPTSSSSSSSSPPVSSHQRRPTTPAIYSIGLHYHFLDPKE